MEPHIPEITNVIQLAVAPVFMLTAVGTLIAALNVRLGRAVDRRRVLEHGLQAHSSGQNDDARAELAQIARRIRYVYRSIVFAVVSGIFVCLLIAGAFIGAFVLVDLTRMVAALFVLAVGSLTVSLLLFLREIFLAVSTPRHVPK
jgi:NADH:ubiquinone oxidoreductase subunit 3 (subunit A)